jgi:hypothetical protein
MTSMEPRLRYLDARRVDTPAGRLDGTVLVTPANATLGTIDGVLIDPLRRQVRYFVVDTPDEESSHHHFLLPLTAGRLDRERHALEVDVDADEMQHLDEAELDELPQFSDDDLLMAMFHSNAR